MKTTITVRVHGAGQYGAVFPAETYEGAYGLAEEYMAESWVVDVDISVVCSHDHSHVDPTAPSIDPLLSDAIFGPPSATEAVQPSAVAVGLAQLAAKLNNRDQQPGYPFYLSDSPF